MLLQSLQLSFCHGSFRFSQHLWRSQDARRLPIDGALCRNKVAFRSSMGQRRGHIVSVARLIKADVSQRVTRVPEVHKYKPATVMLTPRQIDFKDSLETGQLRKQ